MPHGDRQGRLGRAGHPGLTGPAPAVRFLDALSQETCRDHTHTGYGLSAVSHITETSRIQGQDPYPRCTTARVTR